MTLIIHTLSAYQTVIADLTAEIPHYEPNALKDTLNKLRFRVEEIKTVFAVELELELIELEASKARHPANIKNK